MKADLWWYSLQNYCSIIILWAFRIWKLSQTFCNEWLWNRSKKPTLIITLITVSVDFIFSWYNFLLFSWSFDSFLFVLFLQVQAWIYSLSAIFIFHLTTPFSTGEMSQTSRYTTPQWYQELLNEWTSEKKKYLNISDPLW